MYVCQINQFSIILVNFWKMENKSTEIGNKTANINVKNLPFVHTANGDGSKTAKMIKKVTLLSNTLTSWTI